MRRIEESELILNKDGSIFHLHLLPEQIAENVILVGDQDRVEMVSKHFDKIEYEVQNREFRTNTGIYKGKRISVVSTGIGTDNIDIVLNELDAICNIDLKTRIAKDSHKALNIIRIGTSGAIQEDIPVDTPVISEMAIGFDGLLSYYANRDEICNLEIEKAFLEHTNWYSKLAVPYFINSSPHLLNVIGKDMIKGLTISAPGFYAPQGRVLRLPLNDSGLNDKIASFKFNNKRITNFEMESSAIYGLSKLLGHNAVTVCNIIANRVRKEYSEDYKKSMEILIEKILTRILDL
ncbi:MAG: nucleoside phosphorylase [Bacteroidales bacterium]|nr:nucleoside phosphorylase [Bacteroidales bacterium]MBN2755548.1 nucleoside phosphorylase [Bacteroidales bacterium]